MGAVGVMAQWEYEMGMPVWMTRVPEEIWWKVLEMTGRW